MAKFGDIFSKLGIDLTQLRPEILPKLQNCKSPEDIMEILKDVGSDIGSDLDINKVKEAVKDADLFDYDSIWVNYFKSTVITTCLAEGFLITNNNHSFF